MRNAIWRNLRFFTGVLKNLPVSKSLMLDDDKGWCVYTGDKTENWVYYPHPLNDAETPQKAVQFFRNFGGDVSFLWFIYDEGSEKFMTDSGLVHDGEMRAMTLDPGNFTLSPSNPDVKISPASSPAVWAEANWLGFGGNLNEIPSSYISLAEALSNGDNVSLYTAEIDGTACGTFLITNEADLTGVYYFAVAPAFRRKGIARSMMNEICRLSMGKRGKRIVLQATPSGVPFYKSFGFDDLFTIHVYSLGAEG